jgi:hypothetical protein
MRETKLDLFLWCRYPREVLRCQGIHRSILSHAKLGNTTTVPFNLAACLKIVTENFGVKNRMRSGLKKRNKFLVFMFDASTIWVQSYLSRSEVFSVEERQVLRLWKCGVCWHREDFRMRDIAVTRWKNWEWKIWPVKQLHSLPLPLGPKKNLYFH